jgi:hypothetical protein
MLSRPARALSKFGAPSDGGDRPAFGVIYLIPILVFLAVLAIPDAPSILPWPGLRQLPGHMAILLRYNPAVESMDNVGQPQFARMAGSQL